MLPADCNDNGIADEDDLAAGTGQDCNGNTVLDECDVENGTSPDCNSNGVPDECDVASGASEDCNANGAPDECEISPAQVSKLVAADAAASDQFGISVSVSGDTAVVGSWLDDAAGQDSGSAYVFRDVGGVWQQVAKLVGTDAAAFDGFGISISVSGNTAVVGAWRDDHGAVDTGSAYVFRDSGGTWQQIAKLSATDGAAGDLFGGSVSLDGDTAVVGAIGDDDGGSDSGSTYVFREIGGAWQEIAKLTADDAASTDQFGISVSISGVTAVVGAWQDDDAGVDSGSAYVFRGVGRIWQQVAKLTASDGVAGDAFGASVSASGDAAVIRSPGDGDAGFNSGSAYVFRESGGTWQQIAKLTATDGAADDLFGLSVSLNGDWAVIGAYGDDDACAGSCGSGSAYVFRDAGGEWRQVGKLTASDTAPGDGFGVNVTLHADAAVIGSFGDGDPGGQSGSAYVFQLPSTDCNANGIPDDCDLASGWSEDCNGNEVPDECETDCNRNGLADECDLAGGTSQDCNATGVPDECETDCNGNGLADECDLVAGTSEDLDGDGVPDECAFTPQPALWPHDVRMNRYVSFVPAPENTVPVSIRVELLDRACRVTGKPCAANSDCKVCVGGSNGGLACSIASDCPGGQCASSGEGCLGQGPPVVLGWVGDPFQPGGGQTPSGTHAARVVKDQPAPRVWSEDVVHVGDCEIAPARLYGLRGTPDGQLFSGLLVVATRPKPQGKNWGDTVGSLSQTGWTAPNGLVNVDDVSAWIRFVTGRSMPDPTWIDLAPQTPNWLINADDLQIVLQAFAGKPYPPVSFTENPTTDPGNCP